MSNNANGLTERQKSEIEYHKRYADSNRQLLERPLNCEILDRDENRWWNHSWVMYGFLKARSLRGKKTLIVGCGLGTDAVFLSRLGADVDAFDLSPDVLHIAKTLAAREGERVRFSLMAAETMAYRDGCFDCVLACNILHHVDTPAVMDEIVRVAKDGALIVIDEVYSHSLMNRIRYSTFVSKFLYPMMRNFVYKGKDPYITEGERRLTECDMAAIEARVGIVYVRKYFDFFVNRLVPDSFLFLNRIDSFLLDIMKPVAHLLGGRVLLAGTIVKGKMQ